MAEETKFPQPRCPWCDRTVTETPTEGHRWECTGCSWKGNAPKRSGSLINGAGRFQPGEDGGSRLRKVCNQVLRVCNPVSRVLVSLTGKVLPGGEYLTRSGVWAVGFKVGIAALMVMAGTTGCAYVSYESEGARFRAWTLLKDYGLRGVSLDTNGITIGELSGATDDAAVESAARGAVKGVMPTR